MRSPFPGMEPYLESPAIWPGVHASLITTIRELIAPQIAPGYFVDIERRVYVLAEDDPGQRLIVPDVTLVRTGAKATSGTPATRRATPAVLVTLGEPVEVSESRLVIRQVGGDRAVVTAIEVLSPTNKTEGSRGREEYLAKRREVLRSRVNLVEIDLLRGGLRVPSPTPWPEGDYLVHVSRVPMRPRGEAFAWSLRDELPEIPVPLLRQEEATLDLARAVHETYDRARYDLVLDYGAPAVPPLRTEDAAWVAGLGKPRAGS